MIGEHKELSRWSRRQWLVQNIGAALTIKGSSLQTLRSLRQVGLRIAVQEGAKGSATDDGVAHFVPEKLRDREILVQRAVDAAMRAGAQYADARLTHHIVHKHPFGSDNVGDAEYVGIGVRALVNGYWGFSALPNGDVATVESLARQAVTQATICSHGAAPRTVDLGPAPTVAGHWATPVGIDPFTVPLEEKAAFKRSWEESARDAGFSIYTLDSWIYFVREDRVLATSDGGHGTQTIYESGGQIIVQDHRGVHVPVTGIDSAGRGWELLLDAKIPDQMRAMAPKFEMEFNDLANISHGVVGRYTVVCDGATMAAMLAATLGAATQLDRALGYEANAGGTSFLDNPLGMLGSFHVTSPLVNVTANRSAPAQLATVQWDDEGVAPSEISLVTDGVLTDFQTTREQAAWIAPYYAKIGKPVRSLGCAAAESALCPPLQNLPNLSLTPGKTTATLDDLIADVANGILIEQGEAFDVDSQGRNGLLTGRMHKITNGKRGRMLGSGAIWFNTLQFWKNIQNLGGPTTQAVVPFSIHSDVWSFPFRSFKLPLKGQPPQQTGHSAQAVAAIVTNQPLIDPARKA